MINTDVQSKFVWGPIAASTVITVPGDVARVEVPRDFSWRTIHFSHWNPTITNSYEAQLVFYFNGDIVERFPVHDVEAVGVFPLQPYATFNQPSKNTDVQEGRDAWFQSTSTSGGLRSSGILEVEAAVDAIAIHYARSSLSAVMSPLHALLMVFSTMRAPKLYADRVFDGQAIL